MGEPLTAANPPPRPADTRHRDLEGKTFLVTGASAGIGLATIPNGSMVNGPTRIGVPPPSGM